MDIVRAAFRAECAQLTAILSELDDADLDRLTDCPPWTVRELFEHVRAGVARLADMLAEPAPPRAEVDAAAYFGAAKFTPEVDAARIEAARVEAARVEAARVEAARVEAARVEAAQVDSVQADAALVAIAQVDGGRPGVRRAGPVLSADLYRAWRDTDAAVAAAPTERVVRTRHGDAMRLAEFLRTRVVEVGVHGLDLAAALDRPPWLTPQAAAVIADLLTGGRSVPAGLGWDELTVIRKTTGRAELTGPERVVIDGAGFHWLTFGR
ncbi:maleylpyruvate isomerase N-terminal domain-containing protein [Micromonospora sp. CPCC 205539]|uniref:maleylpyruvate isomerase N-terminal domain-containing protein n=1 Tax=Micromonospora sp. CPCC 205539 TaxID=3122408 RepID=UPI002FEFAE87